MRAQTHLSAGGSLSHWRTSERPEQLLFWIFLAGLAWCPFWLGSNRDIAWGINAVLFPALAVAYEALVLGRGMGHPVGIRVVALPAALFAAVFIWIVVQNATWTPTALHHPIWSLTAEVLGRPVEGSISVNRDLTTLGLLRLVTAAAVFWVSMQLCRNPKRAELMIQSIAVIGIIYAVYGLIAFAFAPGTVLWFDNSRMRGWLTSTFVNRNNYATYAGLGLVAMTGMIFKIYRDELNSTRVLLTQYIAKVLEVTGHRALYLLGGGAVIFAALLATASRGGVLASVCGVILLAIIIIAQDQKKSKPDLRRIFISLVMFMALFIAGFFIFGAAFTSRITEAGMADAGRIGLYRLIVRSIFDAPLLGFGYGTFEDVFPLIRDRSIEINLIYDKAHNSYLDLLQGLGLLFGSMLILSIVLLMFSCARGAARRRKNTIVPAIAIASGFVVGAHALVDFSLEIQAVTLTFMALLGAGVAQSESSRTDLSDCENVPRSSQFGQDD